MRQVGSYQLYLISALLLLSCSKPGELITGTGLTVLEGATLISGTGAAPQHESVIVIEGERILRVGRVGEFRYDEGVTVENLSGKYVLPGFIDVHVHPRLGAEADTMRMLLEFGITSIRIPGLGFEQHDMHGIELRDKIEKGRMVGPRINTGAKIIEGPTKTFPPDIEVHSIEEIRAEVRRQADLGVDLVKLYWNTPPEFVRAAIDEAHGLGLQVLGHLRTTSWTDAAKAGIDGLVHNIPSSLAWELAPPDERMALSQLRRPGSYRDFYARLANLIDLDGPWFDELVSALKDSNVTVDPTLVTLQTLAFGDDLGVLKKLEPQLATSAIHATWGENWQAGNPYALNGPQQPTSGKALFPIAKEVTRRFHSRGVHLAVGTDVGMPWITPGVSFHREMELLVEAGIAPADVLVLATRNGAEAMQVDDERGTIQPGKLADLVVLRDSPLEAISNTRSIEAVYKGGQRLGTQTLQFDVP